MAASGNLIREVTRRYKERSVQVAKEMAARIGTPADGVELDRTERARLWLYRAPGVDPAQVAAAMQMQQLTPEQAVAALYPHRLKLIGGGSPKARAEKAEKLASEALKWSEEQALLAAQAAPAIPLAEPLPAPIAPSVSEASLAPDAPLEVAPL